MAELIRHSRIQKKAQDKLDRVVGFEHIMTESDFRNPPYLQSIAKEVLRLLPPTLTLLPHQSNAHVKNEGYDIPKGSNIHINVWAIAHDPLVWSNPLEFRPERFFKEDVALKCHDFRFLLFGPGRRMCLRAQHGINLVMSMLGHLLHHFVWTPPYGIMKEEIYKSESPGLVMCDPAFRALQARGG